MCDRSSGREVSGDAEMDLFLPTTWYFDYTSQADLCITRRAGICCASVFLAQDNVFWELHSLI